MGELERQARRIDVTGRTGERPEVLTRRVLQALGKGQVALLVTDAAGIVIVGMQGIGGMTKLEYKDHSFTAHVHFSANVEILDGSYALRTNVEDWSGGSGYPSGDVEWQGTTADKLFDEIEAARREIDS